MGVLDIILLVCFVPSVIQGLRKGLIKQVFGLAALIAGIWIAIQYTPEVSKWLTLQFTGDTTFVNVLAFILLALVSILVLNIIGAIITKIINLATLGTLNRLLGLIFGVVKTALVLALVICLFDTINGRLELVQEAKLQSSNIYMWLRQFGNNIFPFLKELLTGTVTGTEITNV